MFNLDVYFVINRGIKTLVADIQILNIKEQGYKKYVCSDMTIDLIDNDCTTDYKLYKVMREIIYDAILEYERKKLFNEKVESEE